MEYSIKNNKYGHIGDRTELPVIVNSHRKKPENNRLYTAYEVLSTFYEFNFQKSIMDYVVKNPDRIQRFGIMRNVSSIRLLSCEYKSTKSRIMQDTFATVVDFIFLGNLEGRRSDSNNTIYETVDIRLRFLFDMRPCHKICRGPIISIYDGDDDYLTCFSYKANDYLLPILYKADYEDIAHKMIVEYFPESQYCSLDELKFSAWKLAKRMNINVRLVYHTNSSINGQYFYDKAVVELYDPEHQIYKSEVEPHTILINVGNCTTLGLRNSTLIHECCHAYLHKWFFLLQMMAGKKYSSYANKKKVSEKKVLKTAVDWMEFQCNKMPMYILLEKNMTVAFIEDWFKTHEESIHSSSMKSLIQAVADKFGVSFSMAKSRLNDLGYPDANGIKVYIDNHYVPDHSCSGEWDKNTTYTISKHNIEKLSKLDTEFSDLIQSGKYLYIENHFVLNHKKYLQYDKWNHIVLTEYAREHMNECALAFTNSGKYIKNTFEAGRLSSRRKTVTAPEFNLTVELKSEPGTKLYDKENNLFIENSFAWVNYLYEMPSNYRDILKDIMNKKGITQEELSFILDVDRRVVIRCLNERNVSKAHLVAVCVALKLPFFISEKILHLAGHFLCPGQLDALYTHFLIEAKDGITIQRCEEILSLAGMPTFFKRN